MCRRLRTHPSYFEMKEIREKCASYWNDLIAKYGVPKFYDLDQDAPEHIAANYIPLIKRYLDWFKNEYEVLIKRMGEVGLPSQIIFCESPLDSDIVSAGKILSALGRDIPELCDAFSIILDLAEHQADLKNNRNVLQYGKRAYSDECRALLTAEESYDVAAYRDAYAQLENTYTKLNLKRKREEYLKRLAPVAPQWAEAICNREGIHGASTVPSDIEDAWRWKQYYGIVEEIVAEPFQNFKKEALL